MANKSKTETNKKRIKLVSKLSEKRLRLKSITMDRDLPLKERFEAQLELSKLPSNSSKTRIRNRCKIDGRPRGYHRKYGMSRIWLRMLAADGLIPGLKKASW